MGGFRPAPLYPIVDVLRGDSPRALDLAKTLLEAGCPWLQLRAKETSAAAHVAIARELVAMATQYGGRIIVNDRLDVAVASGAHGVHLGQTDLPLEDVRSFIAGFDLLIGISTHDVAQARAAATLGVDYIGFGPIFPTNTKADAHTPREAGLLAAVRAAVSVPIVAIGGITEATAREVLAEGADAVAMIGELERSPAPGALARRLLSLTTRTQSS